jgi:regulator of protease activity HflC (stomatin/prohibitin superfamily)
MNRGDLAFWGVVLVLMLLADSVTIMWTSAVAWIVVAVFLIPIIALAALGIRVITEFERLVIFRLGRCTGSKGPGLVWVNPLFDRSVPVDLRERFHEVSHEACITKDNAKIDVDFLFYWKVVNPVWSQTRVQNLEASLEGLATGLLRAVIGLFLLDEALAQRERINEELKDELEDVSEHWGVTVTTVEIREIVPPKDIQDAMHRQLAAERDRRAVILEAQGERENAILRAEGQSLALERLYRTAKQIDPKTLQLKDLEALTAIGTSSSTKFVIPIELFRLIRPLFEMRGTEAANTASEGPSDAIALDEIAAWIKKISESPQKVAGDNANLASNKATSPEKPQNTSDRTIPSNDGNVA